MTPASTTDLVFSRKKCIFDLDRRGSCSTKNNSRKSHHLQCNMLMMRQLAAVGSGVPIPSRSLLTKMVVERCKRRISAKMTLKCLIFNNVEIY